MFVWWKFGRSVCRSVGLSWFPKGSYTSDAPVGALVHPVLPEIVDGRVAHGHEDGVEGKTLHLTDNELLLADILDYKLI